VIFVIDSSASINFMNWYVAKQFVMDVIQGLKVSEHQTRIGLVSYSTMVRLDILLGEYFTAEPDMLPEIWQTPYMAGVTNTADGILEMHKMFQSRKRPYVQQIGILLTDGLSNINHDETVKNAEAARADDIEIFSIGKTITVLSHHNIYYNYRYNKKCLISFRPYCC